MFAITLQDPSGIVRGGAPAETIAKDEETLAVEIVHQSFAIKDLDVILQDDAGKYSEMVEESAQLMEEARYDADQYREWVGKGCPT